MENTQLIETTLLVTRNGQPDTDYYRAIQRAERAAQVKDTAQAIGQILGHATYATARQIGTGLLTMYAHVYDDVCHTNYVEELGLHLQP